jgi:hypothetical protein
MEIGGLSLKILQFLSKQRKSEPVVYGHISLRMGLKTSKESEEAAKVLVKNNLAENEEYKIWITQKGKELVLQLEKEELENIYETVFDDYTFTVLKFLYKQEIPLKLEDFPEILKTHAPQYQTMYPEGNLIQFLEFGEISKYVVHQYNKYELNESGKKYFEYLNRNKNPVISIKKEFKSNPMSKVKKIKLDGRRNIIDSYGIAKISWYGNSNQDQFLNRIFDLAALPSYDNRFKTAGEDIHKHTVMNTDWPDEWVFTDARFNILHTDDEVFLNFLCETIHPAIRNNDDEIKTLLEIYNNNLSEFGYEIYQKGKVADRNIYGWQTLIEKTNIVDKIKSDDRKIALVIGCADYTHGGTLANPINDANSIEAKLKILGFDVIKVSNSTQRDLKIAIDEFGDKLKGYDVALFYFAGHGVQVKGLNYIIPVDANLKSEKMVELDCVEANRVLVHMEDGKAKVNIIILDACRDNPFERSWRRGTTQRGLTTMSAPSGSLIAYSTSPGKTASDGDGVNGLYTQALLNHLATKQLNVMSMFQKVRSEVKDKSHEEQIPWESTSLTGDYFFNP